MSVSLNPLLALIERQTADTIRQLYESPSVASAVYRSLPALGQHMVSRQLFVDSSPSVVNRRTLEQCTVERYRNEARAAVDSLLKLGVLTTEAGHSEAGTSAEEDEALHLSSAFQRSLRRALIGGRGRTACALTPFPLTEKKGSKAAGELAKYASDRWEALLIYMALPAVGADQKVSADMRAVLNAAGYVNDTSSDAEPDITSSGFHFLLMDACGQTWAYLTQYLNYRSKTTASIVDLIVFLCQLSFAVPNSSYSIQGLSPSVVEFVLHLREMGVLFMRKRKDGWFYVTPTVAHLCWSTTLAAHADDTMAGSSEEFLVIETNYRVYAYTESQLQLAVVSTFCEMTYRFANMSVGVLTRDSVRRALQLGITAQQIIDYLRSHARSSVIASVGSAKSDARHSTAVAVPPTISDQIRLWELERERLRFDEAVMYSNFDSESDFWALRGCANDCGDNCILWENADRMEVIVSAKAHEKVRVFWQQRRTQQKSSSSTSFSASAFTS